MDIVIENCNNIDRASIAIKENFLNIKFAANGTGKSTIAKAITLNAAESGDLKSLMPFKFIGANTTSDFAGPVISGADEIMSVAVFDTSYIDTVLFKKEELLSNSFEILIKNEEYDEKFADIEAHFADLKSVFSNDPSIDEMREDLLTLFKAFGKATKTSSYSAASVIGKSTAKGNKISNVPAGLEAYSPFLQSEENVQWLKWQMEGKRYLALSDDCPYCTQPATDKHETILRIDEEYDTKTIEHLNALIEIIESLSDYFSDDANGTLSSIIESQTALTDEDKLFLSSIKDQIELLNSKLTALQGIDFHNLKDVTDYDAKILDLRINMDRLPSISSKSTCAIVSKCNEKLDLIGAKIGLLKGSIAAHKRQVATLIKSNEDSINEFLKDAGFDYSVCVESADRTYRMRLRHNDFSSFVEQGSQHLSFGEKNAFALILFMHHVLKTKPDLIVLDDPISSFDKNKKFAIIKRLFVSANSFQNKTVLLMTHDFEPVIDMIYTLRGHFESVSAHFLSNRSSVVSELEIGRSDIISASQACMSAVKSDVHFLVKVIQLRRYFEISANKGHSYNVLASLVHKKVEPEQFGVDGKLERMDAADVQLAVDEIQSLFPDFDYEQYLRFISDDGNLHALYLALENGYSKLQVFRMMGLINKSNSSTAKFINETYHIENDYIMQLDPTRFQTVPDHILAACDAIVLEAFA
jgi:energy-coupling factor transporter ATP-binding protein EcfA2